VDDVGGTPRRNWKGKSKFDLENFVFRKGDNLTFKLAYVVW